MQVKLQSYHDLMEILSIDRLDESLASTLGVPQVGLTDIDSTWSLINKLYPGFHSMYFIRVNDLSFLCLTIYCFSENTAAIAFSPKDLLLDHSKRDYLVQEINEIFDSCKSQNIIKIWVNVVTKELGEILELLQFKIEGQTAHYMAEFSKDSVKNFELTIKSLHHLNNIIDFSIVSGISQVDDMEKIINLESSTHPSYSKKLIKQPQGKIEHYKEYYKRKNDRLIAICREKSTQDIIAFCEILFNLETGECFQSGTAVHPDYRDKKLAKYIKSHLYIRLIDQFNGRKIKINTKNDLNNISIQRINAHFGFKEVKVSQFWIRE